MNCQLATTLSAARRVRGIHAYPIIWARAVSRYLRWYWTRAKEFLTGTQVGYRTEAQDCRKASGQRRLQAGDWVRVKSRAEIEALEKGAGRSDVVVFIPAPMSQYCGQTLRVRRILERYYDELREGLCRAENAVLLEGAICDSSQLGNRRCDRGCLHFWKESWLEHSASTDGPPPGIESPPLTTRARTVRDHLAPDPEKHELQLGEAVRVRDLDSIARTLDERGVCEGVPFVCEHMAAYCGRIFLVSKVVTQFFDEKADYMIRLRHAYMLGGVHCDGQQAGDEPDCDRGCALIWHGKWLEPARLELDGGAPGRQTDNG